jgi:hypothetical protein
MTRDSGIIAVTDHSESTARFGDRGQSAGAGAASHVRCSASASLSRHTPSTVRPRLLIRVIEYCGPPARRLPPQGLGRGLSGRLAESAPTLYLSLGGVP